MGAGIVLSPADAASIGLGVSDGVGGAAGAALATGNPWLAGLSLLAGGGGLFGTKSESTSSAAYSGVGPFAPTNTVAPVYNKPLLDLENPVHIAVLAALGLGLVYAKKKGWL